MSSDQPHVQFYTVVRLADNRANLSHTIDYNKASNTFVIAAPVSTAPILQDQHAPLLSHKKALGKNHAGAIVLRCGHFAQLQRRALFKAIYKKFAYDAKELRSGPPFIFKVGDCPFRKRSQHKRFQKSLANKIQNPVLV